jgi:predicted ribosomally synthesized peptide with nif11-like leader
MRVMAKSAVDFVHEILANPKLAYEIESAAGPEAIVAIGEQHGATFTANEFKQALASAAVALVDSLREMGSDVEFELSVDDLEMVAGGNNNFTTKGFGFETIDQYEKGFDTVNGLLGNKRFNNIE